MMFSLFVTASVLVSCCLSPGASDAVCKTDACEKTAKRILKAMDPEINPCDDFYQFTCANFLKSELPKGKTSVSSFSEVEEVVNSRIREMLEEPIDSKEHNGVIAAKKFYALCIDDRRETSNVSAASNRLLAAGWPVLGGWTEDQWTVHGHEMKLRAQTLSGGGLFHIFLQHNPHNPGKAQITIDRPTLTRQFLQEWDSQEEFVDTLDLPNVRSYHDYMVDLAVMFGADRQTAEDQLRDSLLLELDLEEILDSRRQRHRPYELMTVAELQERAGWVDWPALLAATVVPKSLSLSDAELVKVYEPDYLDDLHRLIQQYPKRVVANFMGWRAAERLSLMLTPEMVARKRRFDVEVELNLKEPWEQCVELVSKSELGLAVSSMYAKKYMTEETKRVVKEMTSNLRETMYTLIKSQTDWMNDDTKTSALLKLCRMHENIGYPKELTDTKKIDEYYQGLDPNMFTNFMEAEIQVSDWMSEYGIFRIIFNDWVALGMVATMVNAFYNPQGNLLELTAAILQPPFFSASLPSYMYYSTMGMVAGHEITHGFDNQGVAYDADGNKISWFDDSSKMNFDEKGECVLNQYSDYVDECNATEAGGPIPYIAGNDSLAEIIADNGGLKLAFLAYKKLSDQLDEPEPLLPNLEKYTRDQMFFISLGSLWCFLYDLKKVRSTEPKDRHPPAEFRVNGIFKNFPQFSETFDCKAGTGMNPKTKCSVW